GKASFVFFSRIVPKKNLISAIKYFDTIDGEVNFDIYGPIEDDIYWKECQDAISKLPPNITVKHKGIIDHDHVFEVLSQYDAFLFPTWSENFGHVISEALFSECPVIISDQTPWRGLEEAGAGWDIELDNSSKFIQAINHVVHIDDNEQLKMRSHSKKYANSKFNLENLKNEYIKALNTL
ncbi:MAG: glycosyltransferase, partial [Clostridia bacterium]|nr:glycosyltransferase [Clostridia bacterium]